MRTTNPTVRTRLAGVADSVSGPKDGVYTARRGFFYRNGGTADGFAASIVRVLPQAVIVETGEKWTSFNGGAPVSKQSHWWVTFTLAGPLVPTDAERAKIAKERDAINAVNRSRRASERARQNERAAEASAEASIGPDEAKRRIDAYVADRRAKGDTRIGLIKIGADGQPYEWMSWETMMST